MIKNVPDLIELTSFFGVNPDEELLTEDVVLFKKNNLTFSYNEIEGSVQFLIEGELDIELSREEVDSIEIISDTNAQYLKIVAENGFEGKLWLEPKVKVRWTSIKI